MAIILSVLLSMISSHKQHYKLRLNIPGMHHDAAGSSPGADGGGGGGGGGENGIDGGEGEGHVASGSSDAEEARQRREERRARKDGHAGGLADAVSGDGRKLQPGEGAAVTHTRIFETGSMLRDGKSTLEYAHMGMLEEIAGGRVMAAWQAAPDLEGGAEQSIYFAYSKDQLGREWGTPHRLPHGAADRSVGASPGQWAPVLFQRGDTTWIFYSENSPKCLRPSVTDAPHPLPKRWIIGGTIYARTLKGAGPAAGGARDDGAGDAVGWSTPQVGLYKLNPVYP
jgi:hypothetical protein